MFGREDQCPLDKEISIGCELGINQLPQQENCQFGVKMGSNLAIHVVAESDTTERLNL